MLSKSSLESLSDQSCDHYTLDYTDKVTIKVSLSQDSKLNLFADCLLLYKIISILEDYAATQGDIDIIYYRLTRSMLILNYS